MKPKQRPCTIFKNKLKRGKWHVVIRLSNFAPSWNSFTLDPPSERIPAILERFGLRRLVHYKWSFLGEYATKVLKRSTPHPGIKIGSKCQQIPLHARVCPWGRHPVMVATRALIGREECLHESI